MQPSICPVQDVVVAGQSEQPRLPFFPVTCSCLWYPKVILGLLGDVIMPQTQLNGGCPGDIISKDPNWCRGAATRYRDSPEFVELLTYHINKQL